MTISFQPTQGICLPLILSGAVCSVPLGVFLLPKHASNFGLLLGGVFSAMAGLYLCSRPPVSLLLPRSGLVGASTC